MIWGLDPATRCTGIACGDGSGKPAIGVWFFDHCGDDLGLLLEDLHQQLATTADRYPPSVVMYESPLLLPSDKLLTLRKIYSIGAYLELWCRQRQIRCEEIGPKAVKKALTGSGNAKKAELVGMCQRLGVRLPTGPGMTDAADAFGVWYVGVMHHAKQHLTAWDQAIYGRRGFLT